MAEPPMVCLACGRSPRPDEVTLGWSQSVERGRPQAVCPSCARDHVRSIEGKLDPEFW